MRTPGQKPAPVRVLVVDDDPQIVEIISLMLDAAGYGVLRAGSGEECVLIATRRASRNHPPRCPASGNGWERDGGMALPAREDTKHPHCHDDGTHGRC